MMDGKSAEITFGLYAVLPNDGRHTIIVPKKLIAKLLQIAMLFVIDTNKNYSIV